VALFGLAAISSGCTHYHYYGSGVPVCETPAPAVASYGAVCDVPSTGSGSARVVASAPKSSVVISQPHRGRLGSGLSWRRPDPESLATTRVEGGIDSSQLR
jgi:hypothetical protein